MDDDRSGGTGGGATASVIVTLALLLGSALWLGATAPTVEGAADKRGSSFTPNATQPGITFDIQAPQGNCGGCHGNNFESPDYQPNASWMGTMMANATRDPIFWAALDVANNDIPGSGEFCLRCHTPTGWLEGRASATPPPPDALALFGGVGDADGCSLDGELDAENNDFSGVSCHLCHRAEINPTPPPGEATFYLENAQLWIDDVACQGASDPCRHGPYDYPDGGPDVPPPHSFEFSTYLQSSEFCGSCHNVTSPAQNLIVAGVDQGILFPAERTYTEWNQSDYRVGGTAESTCQDCHMLQAEDDPAYACIFDQNNRFGELATHAFVGANAWIPQVLKGEYPALGRDAAFDRISAASEALLATAATVDLEATTPPVPGGTFDVAITVTNHSGHKLPTGYAEGRRMWLQVRARDGNGDVFFASGVLDTNGQIDLESDAQAKIYERKEGIWDVGSGECVTEDEQGRDQFHFVLNNCVAVDNRIPPQGFLGAADIETQPVNHTYPETSPGSGVLVHFDVTSYTIPVPWGVEGPMSVEATLRHQLVTPAYARFLRDEAIEGGFADDCTPRTTGPTGMSRGEYFFDVWSRYGQSPPVDMASAQLTGLEPALFADGFESGDVSAWSQSAP